ncbi:uncharacterized protein LOC107648011 isoform X2 [Arachis ipaensis]|uniref:uncharacterized protein LOC107648011 isoform X2 n=1 Tax=Arachis ipaensis TaxID=130454 RepID=UPI000A2B2F61|nr:uncharacterized protein LOC107648011 isoform X2 [Arachis ipaensis]XP_029149329.1 uncharacterized protein LOC112758884 isoform X2 [Arachis hypogaea]
MAHSHTNTLIRKQRDLLLVATGHIVATGHHHHTAPCVVVERTASSPPSVARCTASSRVGAPCASVVVVAFSPGVARGCCCLAVCVIAVGEDVVNPGKCEKARLKEMQKMKKQKLQEILDAQNAAIDADMNNKGKGRLKYLLQQTKLFAHFVKGEQSSQKTRGAAMHQK